MIQPVSGVFGKQGPDADDYGFATLSIDGQSFPLERSSDSLYHGCAQVVSVRGRPVSTK